MDRAARRFLERISRGPAGLLLGQHHLKLGSTEDPILELVKKKIGGKQQTYDLLLSADEAAGPNFLHWLDDRSRSFAPSQHVEAIAQYAWIGVWSSAVDGIWSAAFEKPWREVQRIYSERYKPSDPRNRKRLHCTYLFGSASRTEPDEKVPTSRIGYLKRRPVAQALIHRISETLGPIGTLAIEAYGVDDWLQLQDFVGLVLQMQEGQCHLFSASAEIRSSPEVQELERSGLLTLHEQSLARVLQEGSLSGIIKFEETLEQGDLQRLISFAGKPHTVPRDLWVPLASHAQIVTEEILADLPHLSPDASYFSFRQFLGGTSGRVDWEGVNRGYPFRRDFQEHLEKAILGRASRKETPERPLILHGATSTGKSIALAAAAYRVAENRLYPVIHIQSNASLAAFPIIDKFCQWAENSGASASIVIWDAMQDLDWYENLSRRLAGRGRRVVLVGSTYRMTRRPPRRRDDFIEAPTKLSASESDRIAKYLSQFDVRVTGLKGITQRSDAGFLAFLYRMLPPTRATVRTGLVRELEQVESHLIRKSLAAEKTYEPSTALGWALLNAGLIPKLQLQEISTASTTDEAFTTVEDLTALVMVAAQFGLSVPLELLLRATGEAGQINVPKLLAEVDLVGWEEDAEGNYRLGARSRLEAELIVASRLGSTAREVDYARRLITEARDGNSAISGASEVDFVTSLVRSLGAQGPHPGKYSTEFPAISASLRILREERGLSNPRLMLQEANLLREFVIWSRKNPANDRAYKGAYLLAVLEEAAVILSSALQMVPTDTSSALRSRLHVELAATHAAHAQALRETRDFEDQLRLFQDARRAVALARAEDQESYYPLDVLAWATRDALQSGAMTEEDQSEAIVEVLSAFELLTPQDLDPSQIERYHERRQEFATVARDFDLADQSFDALAERGSGAGVYLRTREIADPMSLKVPLSHRENQSARKALAYMNQYAKLVSEDPRCLNLRFDLWWLLNAKNNLFAEERESLPFTLQQWREALSMIESIEATGESYRDVPLAFLRGLTQFHLGDFNAAFRTFADLEIRSEVIKGRRRIIRSYLASDPQGTPHVYSGEVVRVSRDLKRGEVYVDSLHRSVPFIPSEFRGRDLTSGSNLGSFHIGFNFLGIIADPEAFLHTRRSERQGVR
jgi:hypothetical protein